MKRLIYATAILLGIAGCKQKDTIAKISSMGNQAESVFLTHDQQRNPVVVWTERVDKKLTLNFSASNKNGSFSRTVSLPLTDEVATHAEGMPKVAFKKDGTIIAAYEKKTPSKENKYAGSIYYRESRDGGATWTDERFIHSDTVSGRSRSYFDIEQLPDGEIGASWLDIKLDNNTGGRSVRFAKTNGASGFGNEILVDSSACQCCRIDVYTDIAGRINVAYRGLMLGKMGQPVRDMMIAISDNNGESFGTPTHISRDNWNIDGCPHTGPSLCSSKGGMYSMWYTEGNGMGIYYCFKDKSDSTFGQRQLVSNVGRHPQLTADESRFVMVWEEDSGEGDKKITNVIYQVGNGTELKRNILSEKNRNAFSPVVAQTNNGFLVAFLMETEQGVGMYVAKL